MQKRYAVFAIVCDLEQKFDEDFWVAPCENVSSGICGHRRPRSDCAFAQSDQGLHCPLIEALNSVEKKGSTAKFLIRLYINTG